MDISPDQVKHALLSLIAFIISVSVHEFGHAWMANRLGDDLPRSQGRLTLSPMSHIDPIGTILLPLISALVPAGIPMLAWGKPVQTNPAAYTRRISQRMGHLLVAVTGPLMNLLLAVVASVLFVVLAKAGVMSVALGVALINYLVMLNIMLMFFNLLPVPPLDGGAVLAGVLPDRLQFIAQFLQRYGMIVFFILLMSGALGIVMRPAGAVGHAWGAFLMRFVPA
jgi:Zn-dependent protease